MADEVASLVIKIDSKGVVKASGNLDRLEKESKQAEKSTKKLGNESKKASISMAALAAKVGGIALAYKALGGILKTNATFEKLEASLRTVTGSAEGAERAMRDIQSFATDLPSSVEDLTNAFIKLKALGLEPSEESIKSYSNTAAAMGKDLNQMIEAVADASTMEFERLKEFGIKARQEGDNVSFTFQGVTTTIGKNSKEIQDYLLGIGNVQFAGAAAEQMDTLGGATSNLGVAVDNLSLAIGEAGLTGAATGAVNALSDLANEMAEDLNIVREWAEAETEGKISWFDWLITGSDAAKAKLRELKLEAASTGPLLEGVIIQPGQLGGEFAEEGGLTGDEKASRKQELNAAIVLGQVMHNAQMAETEQEAAALRAESLQASLDAEWASMVAQWDREEAAEEAHNSIMLAHKRSLQDGALALLKSVPGQSKGAMNAIFALEKAFEMSRAWTAGLAAAEAAAMHATVFGGPGAGAAAYAASMGRTKLTIGMMAATSALQMAGGGATATATPATAIESATTGIDEAVAEVEEPTPVNVVIPTGLHSDNDMRALVERLEEVRQDMGGNVQFVTEVR